MNKSKRQMQNLNIYRQQLRKETDAMGYGQKASYEPNLESREHSTLTTWRSIPAALAALGLINAQLQAPR